MEGISQWRGGSERVQQHQHSDWQSTWRNDDVDGFAHSNRYRRGHYHLRLLRCWFWCSWTPRSRPMLCHHLLYPKPELDGRCCTSRVVRGSEPVLTIGP